METWGSWLPADRRAALASGSLVPGRADGAVLVADISGFTPLSEALVTTHGPKRGAEEITAHLDRVYDKLITAVDGYDGSVIGFSGDAITCWFAGDDGIRAVAAALDMQDAMGALSRGTAGVARRVDLAVTIAIAAGPVQRFQVGAPDIQLLDAVAGATVDAVAAVQQLADPGEIALDGTTADRLGRRVLIASTREDGETVRAAMVTGIAAEARPAPATGRIDLDAVTEDQVRPWILRPVHDRLASGQGAFLAELRPVVALFIRFGGIDFSADDAGTVLDRYVSWAQRVLDHYEGTLIDVTIGDKGSYLAAVVGAPRTHDDVVARAANAALALRTVPPGLTPARTLGIGISHGRMRVGAFGGQTRRTYGVQGADMNLAARLMMRAADDAVVVVNSRVADRLRHRFDLTPMGDIRVKGIARSITTFTLDAARRGTARSRDSKQLIGRESEQAAFAARLDATAGQGGILVIEGESGIGKSRLADELLGQAHDRGFRTLAAVADSIEQTSQYHAWRPVLADALGLAAALGLDEAPDDRAGAHTWLLDRLAELAPLDNSDAVDLRALAPLLAPILSIPMPDTSATEFLTGQSRAETTREVLETILRCTARRRPTVILLDDCQWLDSASWSLLTRLAEVPEPLLVVLAIRPLGDQAPPELAEIMACATTQRLALESLPGDAVEALVKQCLGVRSVPPTMVDVIRERTEGHPFFSEELAFALRDAGLVVVRDGRCDLAPSTPDLRQQTFPETVEGVVTSRIDRLSPSQQTALKVASVLGRSFSLNLLRAVHPVPDQAARLDDDLTALTRLDLISVDEGQPDVGYRFKQATTQDVAFDLMLFAQRRALHRVVGEHLESLAQPTGPHLSLLAHHWAAAADHDAVTADVLGKAIGYLGGAAQEASLAYANREAVTHLRKQLGLLLRQPESMDRDQQELGIQVMLAFSLVQSRGYGDTEVESAYRRSQELSDRVEDFGQLAFILYGLFSFYASRGEYEPAEDTAERLVSLSDRLDDGPTRSVGLQARAIVHLLRGDLREALPAARESYEIAERLGDRAFFGFGVDFRLYTSAWLAIAELLLGHPDRATAAHDLSSSAVARQPYARAFVLGFAAVPQLLDDPTATLRDADELAQLGSRYSFFVFSVIADLFRGWALAISTGDPEALGLIDGSLPVMQFVKLDSFLPWYLGLSADARRSLGRLDEALAAVDAGLALTEGAGGSFYEAELHRLRGEIRAAQGAPGGEVSAAFRRAIEVARRQGATWWELRATASLERVDLGPAREVLVPESVAHV